MRDSHRARIGDDATWQTLQRLTASLWGELAASASRKRRGIVDLRSIVKLDNGP